MIEHGRAVTRQMFNELDGAPLGLADLSPPLGLRTFFAVRRTVSSLTGRREPSELALN
jgi:hypothetical protein